MLYQIRRFAGSIAIFAFFIYHACAAAGASQTLKTRHVPAAVSQLNPVRRLESDRRLKLAIGMPLRHEEELQELLRQLYDPASVNYRRWLTPAEFTEKFGATSADYQALEDFATANGLTVRVRHPNRMVLDVEGTASQIESAFHINLNVYRHPSEPREFYAPATEPSLDLGVAILDISGLDDFSIPKPRHRVKDPGKSATASPNGGSGPGGSYRGNDFRAAYVPGNSLNGSGQSVGLLQFDGYNANDITLYENQAGLPHVSLVNVPIDGGVSNPGSGNGEVCLDIEMVISMAPAISQIYVYEAPNPSPWVDLLSRMANDNLAKQLSCSWGGGGVNATAEQIFKQMSAQGQSFFNATGDSDAFTSTIPFPSDSTNITQVGGTTLSTSGPGGAYVSETVWNWGLVNGKYVGSSGGVSTYYGIPDYQLGISMVANQGSTLKRNVPDVALTGDDVYVVYNSGSSGTFGGTSCAAPLWAGLTALINQQASANGLPSVGFMNPAVYNIGKGANYAACFHDITTGNNFSSSSPTKYSAVQGFDLCTGWGTPIGNGLINALAGPAAPLVVSNSFVLTAETCTNGAADPGETVTFTFGLRNIGSANTTNVVATLQAGGGIALPSSPQSYGALGAGGPGATKSFSFVANGVCGGVLTPTLQLQDGAVNLGSVSFKLKLGKIVAGANFAEAFDTLSTPALPAGWTTDLLGGAQTSWVSSSTAPDTGPNSAFVSDSTSAGLNALVSPVIPIASSSAQLTFRNNYNLETSVRGHSTTFYDGGLLEIKIGSGAFTDILAAGGSFVSGGYNCTLASGTGNGFGGRQAWGGNSAGWTTTTVTLPAAALGQEVQLRWVAATDDGNVGSFAGWYIDSISLQAGVYACCGSNTNVPPGILNQPTGQVAVAGATVNFNVAASGTAPLSYGWVFATTNLPGQTNATLSLSNVQPAQAGPYKVIITNIAGSITSSVANLVVLVPPAFTLQPSNKTVIAGSSAAFNALASGSAPLAFQWYFSGVPIGTGSPTLFLTNVQSAQEGNYQVIVTNAAGSITSAVANLTVLVPPGFSLQPSNRTVVLGSNVTFNATATGTAPLFYQWYFNGTTPVGTGSPTLSLSGTQPSQQGNYALVVTNAAGSATSMVAALTVVVPPTFTLQPSNQVAVVGSNVTFEAAAAGSLPLSHQWYFNGTNPIGSASESLILTNVQSSDGGTYEVVVTNSGGSATSMVVTLSVVVPPTLTLQPSNQVAVAGNNVSFEAAATGSAPLSYQWYFNGTNPIGSLSESLILTNVQSSDAGTYEVVVTNSGGSATSMVVTLSVVVPPTLTLQPSNQVAVAGNNVSFEAAATGSAPLSYQWYFNGTNPVGSLSESLILTNVQSSDAGTYEVVVTNSGGSATSMVVTLSVVVPPTFTLQPSNQVAVAGNNVSFEAAATGSVPLSYRWYFNGTNPVGSLSESLILTNVQSSDAGTYEVVVTNSGGSATSMVVTLSVVVPPTFTLQPSNQVAVVGSNVSFEAAAAGSAPLSYQWYFNGTNPVGSLSESLMLTNVQSSDAGTYEVVVTNSGGSATSMMVTLSVVVPPTFTLQPSNQVAVAGNNVSFEAAAGGSIPLSYQWYFNGTNPVGSLSESLILTNVHSADAGAYKVVVTNSWGAATSIVATLTVLTQPILLLPQITSNEAFAFVLNGDTGQTYLIEATTNWQDWEQVGFVSNITGQTYFTETNAANSAVRVYRAKLIP